MNRQVSTFGMELAVMELDELVKAWGEHLKFAGRGASTLDGYQGDVRRFGEAYLVSVGEKLNLANLQRLDASTVEAIHQIWIGNRAASRTIARRFCALRQFVNFLVTAGHEKCAVALSLRFPGVIVDPPPPFCDQDYDLMLAADGGAAVHWVQSRDRAMLLVQGECGLTTSEVVALDWCDLPRTTNIVLVRQTRLAPRILELGSLAAQGIAEYRNSKPFPIDPESPVFVSAKGRRLSVRSVQKIMGARRERARLPMHVAPRSLRHRFVQGLAATNFSPADIGRLSGIGGHTVQYHLRAFDERP